VGALIVGWLHVFLVVAGVLMVLVHDFSKPRKQVDPVIGRITTALGVVLNGLVAYYLLGA
jgi:hypothetical protein